MYFVWIAYISLDTKYIMSILSCLLLKSHPFQITFRLNYNYMCFILFRILADKF